METPIKTKEKIHAYLTYRGNGLWKLLLYMYWSTNAELTEQEVKDRIGDYMRRVQQGGA